ncbi:TonB-dependent receptor domain-containing protein [Novosphingobium sp. BL-52-GroH]|uniref:TonB-dependent receptor domain-containing protein n=1 Tax=Novosphingobium sp. BL-52-GroH TaxID=3349877 RepID=UPI00384D04C0
MDEPPSTIGGPSTTYVSVGRAKVRGIEATIDLPLTRTLRLNATGTLADSEQLTGTSAGQALDDIPRQQASASPDWKPADRFSASVRAVYRGEDAVTEAQSSGDKHRRLVVRTLDGGGWFTLSLAAGF